MAASRNGWQSIKKHWLSDSATYPIILVMAGAMTLCTYFSARTFFSHPDVYLNKNKRKSIIRDNLHEVKDHQNNFLRVHTVNKEPIIFGSINNALLKRKMNRDDDDDDE
jgi:hypothetical protein